MVRFHASETKLIRCGGEATLLPGFPSVSAFAARLPTRRKSGASAVRSLPAMGGAKGAISPVRITHHVLAESAFWAQISAMAGAPDYYATLGVSPDADQAVIRAAWKALLRKYHPDTAHGVPDAADRTRAFNAAWAVLGNANRRIAYDLERAAPPDDEARPGWASPYPMPPRRGAGTTLLLILAFVGLPAVAITLPGVPGQVAAMLPGGDGGSAASFTRSSFRQVRRLLTPTGFGAGSAAASPVIPTSLSAPVQRPAAAPQIDRATIRLAVRQYGRVIRRDGRRGVAAFSRACAQRAASLARWESVDFCAAFDITAGRDTTASAVRYIRLGAAAPIAAQRVEQIHAEVRRPDRR
jgi:curved DNA-binding protein CbpA